MNGVITAGVRPASHVQAAVTPTRTPWGFPELFVISQTALPALLYLPGSQAFRLPLRFSAFAIVWRRSAGGRWSHCTVRLRTVRTGGSRRSWLS